MKRIRCLLFDLDGTLLDSRDSVIDAVYDLAETYVPGRFTRDDLLRRFGEPIDSFLQEIEPYLQGRFTREQMLASYFAHVRTDRGRNNGLFPFVKEGLEQLKSAGFRLGVVTNKQREFASKELRFTQVYPLFDAIVTLDDVREGKPSAEPVLQAMERVGARPEETLMVGDSKYDVLAARVANVKSAVLEWYGNGHVANPVPDYRFPGFREFAERLLTQT